MPLPTPFLKYDYQKAIQLLTVRDTDALKLNRKFIDGDHWQDGGGYIGPRPGQGEDGELETMALLKAGFTSANKIAEVSERHSDGVVGREPRWGFIPKRALKQDEEPTTQEQAKIDEIEAFVTRWWNNKHIHSLLQRSVTKLMWAERSPMRLYVPAAYLAEGGKPSFEDFEAALDAVFLDALEPEQATVYVDEPTKREFGIFKWKDEEDIEHLEVYFLDNANALTIIRQMTQDKTADFPLNFGGRLPMHEMRRSPFITQQIQQNQRALNLALSVIPRNVTTAGFLERILLNAQMPGTWEVDATTGERKRFIPTKFRVGAGTTQFIQGSEVTDTQGNTTLANPSVTFREPVSPLSTIQAADEHYRRILEEADQQHVLMADDATASGRSRIEARTDYLNSLRRTVPNVESAGRWLLETAVSIAEALMNQPGLYTESLRADFSCRIQQGQVTPEERAQNVTEVKEGIMPKEYAMSESGIDDVDAALAVIAASPEAQTALLKARADIVKLFTDAGCDLATAGELAGLDAKQIALLKKAAEMTADEGEGTQDDDAPLTPPRKMVDIERDENGQSKRLLISEE